MEGGESEFPLYKKRENDMKSDMKSNGCASFSAFF